MALENTADLAAHLEISEFELSKFIFRTDSFYKEFSIPKKSGGERKISSPSRELKRIQKWISANVLKAVPLHESCTGYRRGRSIVDNARPHVGKDFVLNVDIEDFFPSINLERIAKLFESIQLPPQIARPLARLCTHNTLLPQGAPTSPDLANLVCSKLDELLSLYCQTHGWSYTRYCDDITISGNGQLTRQHIDSVCTLINSQDFSVNDKKLRVARKTTQQTVTGLVVNERVNLPRRERRRVRAMVHQKETKGASSKSNLNKIDGHIAYCRMVTGTPKSE